jgi:hypothetical protein
LQTGDAGRLVLRRPFDCRDDGSQFHAWDSRFDKIIEEQFFTKARIRVDGVTSIPAPPVALAGTVHFDLKRMRITLHTTVLDNCMHRGV